MLRPLFAYAVFNGSISSVLLAMVFLCMVVPYAYKGELYQSLDTGLTLTVEVFGRWLLAILVGIMLFAATHISRPAKLGTHFNFAPPKLSAQFANLSSVASATSWTLLDATTTWFWTKAQEA